MRIRIRRQFQYSDFVLQLSLRSDGNRKGCEVRVRSPEGEADGWSELPAFGDAIRSISNDFERARAGEPGRASGMIPGDRLRAMGGSLFKSLFPEDVRLRWESSKAQLGPRQGLRIKIQINLKGAEGNERALLHALPWEYLYDDLFVGLDQRFPIVRYLELPQRVALPPKPRRLRILTVLSEPKGLPPLPALKAEVETLEEIGRTSRGLDIVRLETATLDALRNELQKEKAEFHVLHFMGHGGFQNDEGVLYFKGSDGSREPITGEDLAVHLQGHQSLFLVFLNACETARAAEPAPFSGVATALVRAGIPAVVAMQFPVTDRGAQIFAKEVYRRIAAGDPVDAAVTKGRQALHANARGSQEWGTPALFLRTPDGRLVEERKPLRLWRWLAVLLLISVLPLSLWLRGSNAVQISLSHPYVAASADTITVSIHNRGKIIRTDTKAYGGETVWLGQGPARSEEALQIRYPVQNGECVEVKVRGKDKETLIAQRVDKIRISLWRPVYHIELEIVTDDTEEEFCP